MQPNIIKQKYDRTSLILSLRGTKQSPKLIAKSGAARSNPPHGEAQSNLFTP
ncbi:hypothetical protein [Geminocystis herdmanii]|uniref:hypothetical protein n=1 Tax=Geminocystis herdmanii TaxID=669359 RepID=UPI0003483036|nr:hypothetical protein [Geminocystis herdmanii]